MLEQTYTLFGRIPLIKDESGRLFCDPLWAKDLLLHLDYSAYFNLCCPIEYSQETDGLVDITDANIKEIFALKKDGGLASVIKNFFPQFFCGFQSGKRIRNSSFRWSRLVISTIVLSFFHSYFSSFQVNHCD